MERLELCPSQLPVSEMIDSLISAALLRAHQLRLIEPFISRYSLIQCHDIIEIAVEFGHNHELPIVEADITNLRSQKLTPFVRDPWSGQPQMSKVIVPRPSHIVRPPKTLSITPSSTSNHTPKATTPLIKNSRQKKHSKVDSRFVKLAEAAEDDDSAQEMREKKTMQWEFMQERHQIETKLQTITEADKANATLQGKYTFDYNGKRIARKQVLHRKGVAQPMSIECKQINRINNEKQTVQRPRDKLLSSNNENSVIANCPIRSLSPEAVKEFLNGITFETGVKLEQCDFGSIKLNRQLNQCKELDLRLRHENPTPPNNTPTSSQDGDDIMGLSRIEPSNIRVKDFQLKRRKGQIAVSQNWRRDVIRHFRINTCRKNSTTSKMIYQDANETTLPLNPITNYDMQILHSPKWGSYFDKSGFNSLSAFSTKPQSFHHHDQQQAKQQIRGKSRKNLTRLVGNCSLSSFHFGCA